MPNPEYIRSVKANTVGTLEQYTWGAIRAGTYVLMAAFTLSVPANVTCDGEFSLLGSYGTPVPPPQLIGGSRRGFFNLSVAGAFSGTGFAFFPDPLYIYDIAGMTFVIQKNYVMAPSPNDYAYLIKVA